MDNIEIVEIEHMDFAYCQDYMGSRFINIYDTDIHPEEFEGHYIDASMTNLVKLRDFIDKAIKHQTERRMNG